MSTGVSDIVNHVPVHMINIFVDKQPRDLVHGLGGGVANLGIGVVGATALVIAAPVYGSYIGANANGFVGGIAGFGIGLGVGIVGSCVLVGIGVYTCLTQIFGGISTIIVYEYSHFYDNRT